MNPGIKRALQVADQITARMAQISADNGRPMTCTAGCSACCDEALYVDRTEVERALANLSQAERDEVAAATRVWIEKVKGSPLLAEKQPNAFAWRLLKATCPFLKGTLCRIYPRRPWGCRAFMVSGPREKCEDLTQRLDQEFIECPELIHIVGALMIVRAERVEHDHLGAILSDILLGEPFRTGSYDAKEGDELAHGQRRAAHVLQSYASK